MGPGRPSVMAVTARWPADQSGVLPRGPRGTAAPATPPRLGPRALGIRRGCLVHVVLTTWARHSRRINAGRPGAERTRSHRSRKIDPEPLGSPARNEPPGRAVTPA